MDKVNNIMGGNEIEKLKEHAAITQAVYDDYWRYVRNNGDPINWNVMESLANRANMAANDVTEEEGFDIPTTEDMARWQECTCRPQDALLCPSCLEYNRRKYGDSIPFSGTQEGGE